jgi:hypothetical protein
MDSDSWLWGWEEWLVLVMAIGWLGCLLWLAWQEGEG